MASYLSVLINWRTRLTVVSVRGHHPLSFSGCDTFLFHEVSLIDVSNSIFLLLLGKGSH